MNKQRNDFQAMRVHQQLTEMPGEIVSCPDHRCSSRAPRAPGDTELDGLWKFLQVYGTTVPWEVKANAKHLPLCILDALFLNSLWMKGSQVHWYWCNVVRSEAFRILCLIAKRTEVRKSQSLAWSYRQMRDKSTSALSAIPGSFYSSHLSADCGLP